MGYEDVGSQITEILVTAEQIDVRLSELVDEVSKHYKNAETGKSLLLLGILKTDINNRDVLIVEDIIDSGTMLGWLVNNLANRGARSVEVLSLLQKKLPSGVSDTRVKAKWLGFEIENKFVVGYGLDFNEKYRALLPFVGVLSPSEYSNCR